MCMWTYMPSSYFNNIKQRKGIIISNLDMHHEIYIYNVAVDSSTYSSSLNNNKERKIIVDLFFGFLNNFFKNRAVYSHLSVPWNLCPSHKILGVNDKYCSGCIYIFLIHTPNIKCCTALCD